jgi:hypothetical protein
MSIKIVMALVTAVIACASPALAGGNRDRNNEYTYKTAQYLMNHRARQGFTAERGAVTGGVEILPPGLHSYSSRGLGPKLGPFSCRRSCQQQHPARQLCWSDATRLAIPSAASALTVTARWDASIDRMA